MSSYDEFGNKSTSASRDVNSTVSSASSSTSANAKLFDYQARLLSRTSSVSSVRSNSTVQTSIPSVGSAYRSSFDAARDLGSTGAGEKERERLPGANLKRSSWQPGSSSYSYRSGAMSAGVGGAGAGGFDAMRARFSGGAASASPPMPSPSPPPRPPSAGIVRPPSADSLGGGSMVGKERSTYNRQLPRLSSADAPSPLSSELSFVSGGALRGANILPSSVASSAYSHTPLSSHRHTQSVPSISTPPPLSHTTSTPPSIQRSTPPPPSSTPVFGRAHSQPSTHTVGSNSNIEEEAPRPEFLNSLLAETSTSSRSHRRSQTLPRLELDPYALSSAASAAGFADEANSPTAMTARPSSASAASSSTGFLDRPRAESFGSSGLGGAGGGGRRSGGLGVGGMGGLGVGRSPTVLMGMGRNRRIPSEVAEVVDEIDYELSNDPGPSSLQHRSSNSHPHSHSHPKPRGLDSAGEVGGTGRVRLARKESDEGGWNGLKSLEKQRDLVQAYEYLCHVGEAKAWMDRCLISGGEPEGTGGSIVELELNLRDGVVLAKLARRFKGQTFVPRIFIHPKLQFRHSDNINAFFRFVREEGLPEIFSFELTDLYEAKNLPKVIYCIHALSHFLARKGMAEKIGNLVGKLEFSQDDLHNTKKGLESSGVAMPNFGGIGKALAKETGDVEPEPEPEPEPEETEEERIERELGECEREIVSLQAGVRGVLARRREEEKRRLLKEAKREVVGFQARARGMIARRTFAEALEVKRDVDRWTVTLQAAVRGKLARSARKERETALRDTEDVIPFLQAHIRGALVRSRLAKLRGALRMATRETQALQALLKGKLGRQKHRTMVQRLWSEDYGDFAIRLQAQIRGVLIRRNFFSNIRALDDEEATVKGFQALARGFLARKRYEDTIMELSEAVVEVVGFQGVLRGVLARRQLLNKIRALRGAEDAVTGLQAHARGGLARAEFRRMSRALQRVEVSRGVGGLQAFARAALARKKVVQQKKELDFVAPDVVGFQAQVRGALVRREFTSWRDYLLDSQPEAVYLQALVRGFLARRRFWMRMRHFEEHMEKIVKIQSIFRGKQQVEQYKQLTMGKNVPLETIKNFIHLLNDSDFEFNQEIEVENLRQEVVKVIRSNQNLEQDVTELEVKNALLVKNKITLDEVARARRSVGGTIGAGHRNSILAAHKDPFASTLDRDSKRKLELYQQLFYLLQTKPEYLARLFAILGKNGMAEKNRKVFEGVVLTLFGYAQNSREEFLLLRVLQSAVQEEMQSLQTVEDFIHGKFMFINLCVQYGRGLKERKYLRDTLAPLVDSIISHKDLDLETDPVKIYRACITAEESRTGLASRRPIDVNFHQALQDEETQRMFIKHLQLLRATTESFLNGLTASTRRMPYGLRFFSREVFFALKSRFPEEVEETLVRVACYFLYYRFINPAIVAPEALGVVDKTIDPLQRANLAEVSKMLNQISIGRLFGNENPYLQPLNEYVTFATNKMSTWFREVIDVVDADQYFHADEYLDHTISKPVIYISPNEIYATHSLVMQHLQYVAPGNDNPLRSCLIELGAAPSTHASDDLDAARSSEVALTLTNRFSEVRDPHSEEKNLFVKTKRYVLSLLKVQHGSNLVETFLLPVTEENEEAWARVIAEELDQDRKELSRRHKALPSPDMANQLEDVRNLSFKELKVRTLENMLKLEQLGKVTRANNYQDMLNAIANDIRMKHRKRMQREADMKNMYTTLSTLEDKRTYLQDQIKKYHEHIESSMATMQKKGKKKRLVLPWTSQYFHMRHLEKMGKVPQFGSYKYTAQRLHEKGVLISIEQHSARELHNISLTISSDEVGVFLIECAHSGVPIPGGTIELRMEDLLERQFNNAQTININSVAKFNLNLLLFLINKKFYV